MKKLWTFVTSREPIVILNFVAGVAAAVAAEVNGNLPAGKAGWVALAWAVLVVVSRQLVTPAIRRSD